MKNKIQAIATALQTDCFIKAADFDTFYKGIITNGGSWNQFAHKNCVKYNIEIWKDASDKNYYVNATKKCRDNALMQNLKPFTTSSLYRGDKVS